jgi:hypothetical protein
MVVLAVLNGSWKTHAESLQRIRQEGQAITDDVLVLYIFSNTDPEYMNNLKFFLREGVHPADGCEYLFVVNRDMDEVSVQRWST